MARADQQIQLLLTTLQGAFASPGWQGPTLWGSLRGLTVETLTYRPRPNRKCIWEHALHAAYWKYIVARQLDPGLPESFGRSPSNWPALPAEATPASWKSDLALLRNSHETLLDAVRGFPPGDLDAKLGKRKWTAAQTIVGAAAHDAYHTGQIKLLKHLAAASSR